MAFRKKTGTNTKGDLWREPEYPGYKNRKQAERGGSRRDVAKEKVQDAITRKGNPGKAAKTVKPRAGGDLLPQSRAQKRAASKPITRNVGKKGKGK